MCAWIRCSGGTSKKKINTDIGLLSFVNPSPSGYSPSNRTFTKGTYCKGLVRDNTYLSTPVTITQVSNKTITIRTTESGYGFDYVLPADVSGGDNLNYNVTVTGSFNLYCYFYTSNGSYISYADLGTITSGTVLIPSNAEYILFFCNPTVANSDVTLTINSLSV